MFSSISWSQYLSLLTIVLLGYYCFIGYKYYRWEILSLIGIKKVEEDKSQIPVAELKKQFTGSNHADFMPKGDKENMLQAFADEIKAYLFQASPAAAKQQLLFAFQQIVSKHPTIENMENRNTINQFILEETEKQYQGMIQPEDLIIIWS